MSLRRALLLLLMPALLLLAGVEFWLGWRTSVDAANAAYDRSLYGAIKSIDANVSTASGGIAVELPYRLLEFFELTASGQVYYRVATEDGLVDIGNAGLPLPRGRLVTGRPSFIDAEYFGEPLRVGSLARVLENTMDTPGSERRIVIQVAETLESRQDFTRAFMLQTLSRDLLLLGAVAALLLLGVRWALRPLLRLRDEVRGRAPEDLAPIDAAQVPSEVRPLVDAINHHIGANRELVEAQRRFVDDASHQLRTPLTTLTTQVGYALREADPQRMRAALIAIRVQLDDTVRRVNQMLLLARADSAAFRLTQVDLVVLAEKATRHSWQSAREKGIDLGFELGAGLGADGAGLAVQADAGLLGEALANLLDNAIRCTPADGRITVRVERDREDAVCSVIDNGPGIPADERSHAGTRFFRASNARGPGSGIGLAIVVSIMRRHGGVLRLDADADGRGCVASIRLPCWIESELKASPA